MCPFKFKTTTNEEIIIIYHSWLNIFLESFILSIISGFRGHFYLFSALKTILRVESYLLISLLFCLNSLVPRNKKNGYAKWIFEVFLGMLVRNKMRFLLIFQANSTTYSYFIAFIKLFYFISKVVVFYRNKQSHSHILWKYPQ